jgi:hypothetical protein
LQGNEIDPWLAIEEDLQGRSDPNDVAAFIAPTLAKRWASHGFDALTTRLKRCDLWAVNASHANELGLTSDAEVAVMTLWGEWRASGGWSRRYIRALQLAATRVFKLTPSFDTSVGLGSVAAEILARHMDVFHRIIETQYEMTQATLKGGSIVAFRGVGRRTTARAGDVDPRLRPMSAFSLDQDIARAFAREARGQHGSHAILVEASIPAERVLATPATGLASFDEREVIVLGAQGTEDDFVRECEVP